MAPFNKRLPSLPGLQAIEQISNSPEIPTTPSGRVTNATNRDPVREGQYGTGGTPWRPNAPWAIQGSADYNLQRLFSNLNGISAQSLGNQRTGGGGSGGGSMDFAGNMDANPLIGLNPYLEENVTSFSHGGSMDSTGHTGRYRAVNKYTGAPMPVQKMLGTEWKDTGSGRAYYENERRKQLYYDNISKDMYKFDHGGSMSGSSNKQNRNPILPANMHNIYKDLLDEDQMNKIFGPEKPRSRGGSFGIGTPINWPEYKPYAHENRTSFGMRPSWQELLKNRGNYHAGGKHILEKIYPSHQPKYAGGGMYEQQANQSIQASQQANEQQMLGQLSGVVARSLQNKMSPEEATAMASQMAEQSGLVNQPMANQGMRMNRYSHGGAYEQSNVNPIYGDNPIGNWNRLDPTQKSAYLKDSFEKYKSDSQALNRGEIVMSADGRTGKRKKRYTQGGRF